MMAQVGAAYPNLRLVATTLRAVVSASRNDWSAVCWAGGMLYRSVQRPGLEILDRVGGGDSFASGLIYGLLSRGSTCSGRSSTAPRTGLGHDHARRHVDGDARRSRRPGQRRVGEGTAMSGANGPGGPHGPGHRRHGASIRDVARLAGLSPGTASRVLSGSSTP